MVFHSIIQIRDGWRCTQYGRCFNFLRTPYSTMISQSTLSDNSAESVMTHGSITLKAVFQRRGHMWLITPSYCYLAT
ncbi:hypothetical protein BDV36DRAFT_268310 [Aspergillus pseudocaelatus]|uniref:Uncharacterized protein n=1 Tax=Aspergillus pseudocaelatus TaxID=1825620 RepID=A0ABQ6W8K1_9EURO|nr:hypothetical protein BDV36DRAFT_268310 [Aspergillus pseudocaelatus]